GIRDRNVTGVQTCALPISFVKNLSLPFKMARSLWQANKILKKFGAEAAIGVGGFASGPLLLVAGWMGIPTLLQEQNSYAGLTNRSEERRVGIEGSIHEVIS